MKHTPTQPVGVSEEEQSFTLTRMLYMWANDQLARGSERNAKKELLELDDLLQLPRSEDAQTAYQTFLTVWEVEKQRPQPSVARALRKAFGGPVYIGGFFALVVNGCQIANPFLLLQLIEYLGKWVYVPGTNNWEGYLWAFAMCMILIISSYSQQIHLHLTVRSFQNMRSAITIALYEKALKLDGNHPHTGIVQQMHTTDSNKLLEMGIFIHSVWTAPLTVIASLIALYYFIGWAGVMSLGIIFVLLPFNGWTSAATMATRAMCSTGADRRMAAISEFIQGIRVVKFMCWEDQVEKHLQELRAYEVGLFRRLLIMRSLFLLFVSSAPMLIVFGVFAIAYALGEDINPKTVFPTMAMLNILRLPLAFLPMAVARLLDTLTALKRIQAFMLSPEHKDYVQADHRVDGENAIELEHVTIQFPQPETSVEIEAKQKNAEIAKKGGKPPEVDYNALFAKRPPQDFMPDINIAIPKGKLTLVVGPTGSGKSSLVRAMSGEAWIKEGGAVKIHGGTALVSQEAWIMNATLRDNILMGCPYDEEKYISVVHDCQLMQDLHQLSGSDQTEIGERGINLSGGQKQRIAFARAVYSGRPIVLMDDPLSAVDAHVCLALFEECICGAMADRTRVLVTHQVQFLSKADHIIVVKDASIAFHGSYAELEKSGLDLSALIPQTEEKKSVDDTAIENLVLPASPAKVEAESPTTSPSTKQKKERSNIIPKSKEEQKTGLMTNEGQEVGSVKAEVVRWFYKTQGYFMVLITIFIFGLWRLSTVICDLMMSWWSSRTKILDYSLSNTQYIYWFAIFVGISIIMTIIRQIPFTISVLRSAKGIHEQMVTRVLHSPMHFFDTTPTGRIINRFSKDIEIIDIVIPESLNFFYNTVWVVLGAFGVMCYSAPYLTVVVVFIFIVYYFVLKYYTATNRAVKRLESTSRSPVVSVMNETLGGLASMRAYGMSEFFSEKHLQRFSESIRPSYVWRIAQRWMGVRVDFIGALITLGTTFISIALLTQNYSKAEQKDQLPVILLGITYAITITTVIGFMTQQTAELESMFSSIERVYDYTTIEQERDVTYSNEPDGAPAPPSTWPDRGEIAFDNVSMRYREGLPLVLKDVSFHVKPGHKIGLVGRTGSGKSSIMLALFRMVEAHQGTIRFDGVDISRLRMKDLRSAITIIPQDPLLFAGTMRTNLDPFFKHNPIAIWSVLTQIGLASRVKQDVLDKCPTPNEKWLEAPIAEKGSNYSVGQRQLLCLARALLKKTKILLLDEATASVDSEADDLIQKTIRENFAECTVLTIAHRLQTIMGSDMVLVLDHGVVKEYDTPRALLENQATQFYSMVSSLGEAKFAQMKALVK